MLPVEVQVCQAAAFESHGFQSQQPKWLDAVLDFCHSLIATTFQNSENEWNLRMEDGMTILI